MITLLPPFSKVSNCPRREAEPLGNFLGLQKGISFEFDHQQLPLLGAFWFAGTHEGIISAPQILRTETPLCFPPRTMPPAENLQSSFSVQRICVSSVPTSRETGLQIHWYYSSFQRLQRIGRLQETYQLTDDALETIVIGVGAVTPHGNRSGCFSL